VAARLGLDRWAVVVTVRRRERVHFFRRLAALCSLAVLVVTAVIAAPGLARWAVTIATAAPTGLPACHTADLLAPHAGYDEWADTLLDPANALPETYEPPDLVVRQLASGRVRLRSFVFDDLEALLDAAASAGIQLTINSSYRSFAKQAALFRDMQTSHGSGYANEFAARPGHSEHQLGTTLDLGGGDAWLADNAWRYGFVQSYPAARSPTWTCYGPEPWHYRYFGRERAAAIHASGLSPREWLFKSR
jgi:D-alanyl-D-alanine carboxypeptidase